MAKIVTFPRNAEREQIEALAEQLTTPTVSVEDRAKALRAEAERIARNLRSADGR
jgi:hypothetical protein